MKYRLFCHMRSKIQRFSCSVLNGNSNQPKLKETAASTPDLPSKLSTLYVPGRYGIHMYQIVKPHVDVLSIEQNMINLKKSCSLRGITLELENVLLSFYEWDRQKKTYSDVIDKNNEYLSELKALKSSPNASNYDDLKKEHTEFIDILKVEKEKLNKLEELVLPVIQKIPNLVDPSTPLHCDEYQDIIKPLELDYKPVSHSECTEIKILNPVSSSYYLSGNLAELEMKAQFFIYDRLQTLGFHPFSCADFCKSFVVEAVGCDPHSQDQCIQIKEKGITGQKQLLVGNASLESFCTYLTNMNADKCNLPAKYVSVGRRYNAANRQVTVGRPLDLFSVVQSTNAHVVILCDVHSHQQEFDTLVCSITSLYSNFKIPFRTVSVCAKNLNVTESRRKQWEVWSPFKQEFVPVAHVSQRGDFLSKRLNITYGVQNQIEAYCYLVEGVVANLSTLIGCLVENSHHPNQEKNTTKGHEKEFSFLYE